MPSPPNLAASIQVDIIEPSANLLHAGKRMLEQQHAAKGSLAEGSAAGSSAAGDGASAPVPVAAKFAYFQAGLQQHELEKGR